MATRTETITLNETELKEAIMEWLNTKYGGRLQTGSGEETRTEWNLSIQTHTETNGIGRGEYDTHRFSAVAHRQIFK